METEIEIGSYWTHKTNTEVVRVESIYYNYAFPNKKTKIVRFDSFLSVLGNFREEYFLHWFVPMSKEEVIKWKLKT